MENLIKLDIWCWENLKEWFIWVDKRKVKNAKFILNLDKEKLPFDNETIDEIYSAHSLEHVDDVETVFLELIRVLKVWWKMTIKVPFYSSPVAFEPTHKAFFNLYSFNFFVEWRTSFKLAPTYLKFTKEPRVKFNYFNNWKDLIFKPFEFFANKLHKIYVFSFAFIFPAHEVEFNFEKVKKFDEITWY